MRHPSDAEMNEWEKSSIKHVKDSEYENCRDR